ncbi:hypothetical protein EDC04DRAFT_2913529 [Pisolithus marmoratus]|nr:hypothetical protein EDC04DRAFT_2913529 [Pisolithus marmoratus]
MSFTKGNGPGPDPINLQWDFTGPVSSLWNQAVVEILLDKLHVSCTEEKWTTKPRSNEYWKEAIKQKFSWIKVIWTKGRPKRLETGILETPAQVAARLMHTKMDDLKDTQKDTQRVAMSCFSVLAGSILQDVQKFCHHSTVTKSFLCTEMAQGTKDVELWQWLSDVIDHPGTDGMSSEDSEEEDMQTVFRVHSMPWRRDINKELRFIDSKHKDWSISSPKGAKPVKCIRPSNPFPSAHQPVCDLPATFYKPEWLEGNPTFKSDKVFQWLQFIVQGI